MKKNNLKAENLLYLFQRPVPDEIIQGLYLGQLEDGILWGMKGLPAIYVHELPWTERPLTTEWMPILRYSRRPKREWADVNDLERVAQRIDFYRENMNPVLVHCYGGVERSPLAIAYYLHTRKGLSFDEAYDLIRAHRPMVLRRDYTWLYQNPLE